MSLRKNRHSGGFTLMEIVVSLVIIGVALSVILRSFVASADANMRTEISTTSLFLAQKILYEVEFDPETFHDGSYEGIFGDDYPNYYWTVTASEYEPEYDDLTLENNIEDITRVTEYEIAILYNDQRGRDFTPLSFKTISIGKEKFSYQSLQSQMKEDYLN